MSGPTGRSGPTERGGPPERSSSRGERVARHERPVIDDAALAAARHADRLLAAAEAGGIGRWATFLAPFPDRLRDDELPALRRTAMRARAAYGPADSIRDSLPSELTEPFLDSLDRLLRELARADARR